MKQKKKLYLPALSIVAIVILLLVFIIISTYKNLDRDEKRAKEFVHREGSAIIDIVEAGACASLSLSVDHLKYLENIINGVLNNKDIAYIYLVDSNNRVMLSHQNYDDKGGKRVREHLSGHSGQEDNHMIMHDASSHVYELSAEFPCFSSGVKIKDKIKPRIVLGMKTSVYDEAHSADMHHAMVMGAIVIILGSGAFFFIFVIQNYYIVESTLFDTQDYTRQVVASMANGLLSIDGEGKILSYNILALNLLGLDESKIHEMDLKKVIDFKKSGIFNTFSDGKSVLDREISIFNKSGEKIPLALSVTPLMDTNGKCKAAVIVLRDLREIKRLEEKVWRSEKLAAIGELAAAVAHEIRNPLSSVRGFAQFLSHSLVNSPKEQEYASVMVKEIDRINRVVTGLLSFAKPMEAKSVLTDVRELLLHTVTLVKDDAASRGINICLDIPDDLKKIPLDNNQLTQALLNLLLNSIQAMDKNGSLKISAGVTDDGTGIFFHIDDDGPGIPHEYQGRIFDPFFTTKERGTGLGLAIVSKIAENHNGKVSVESPPGGKNRGSRFIITIPLNNRDVAVTLSKERGDIRE